MNEGRGSDRKSLGDAFLEKVNRSNNHQEKKDGTPGARNQSMGIRMRDNSDGRLSIGEQFMISVNKKNDDENDDGKSNQSQPKMRSGNIFNKVRAMQASQKFSVMSEGGGAFQKNKDGSPSKIFAKKEVPEDNGIVDRDDGGKLVSIDQMARNLIEKESPSKRPRRESTAKKNKLNNSKDHSKDQLSKSLI